MVCKASVINWPGGFISFLSIYISSVHKHLLLVSMFSIRTGICWYFVLSWPFQMGSHWQHWTANSSLSALAVNDIISFTQVNLKIWACFKICSCLSETKDQWHIVWCYMFRSYYTCYVYGAWTSTAVLIFFFYI